jgi:hypothetical protein
VKGFTVLIGAVAYDCFFIDLRKQKEIILFDSCSFFLLIFSSNKFQQNCSMENVEQKNEIFYVSTSLQTKSIRSQSSVENRLISAE